MQRLGHGSGCVTALPLPRLRTQGTRTHPGGCVVTEARRPRCDGPPTPAPPAAGDGSGEATIPETQGCQRGRCFPITRRLEATSKEDINPDMSLCHAGDATHRRGLPTASPPQVTSARSAGDNRGSAGDKRALRGAWGSLGAQGQRRWLHPRPALRPWRPLGPSPHSPSQEGARSGAPASPLRVPASGQVRAGSWRRARHGCHGNQEPAPRRWPGRGGGERVADGR